METQQTQAMQRAIDMYEEALQDLHAVEQRLLSVLPSCAYDLFKRTQDLWAQYLSSEARFYAELNADDETNQVALAAMVKTDLTRQRIDQLEKYSEGLEN